MRAGRLRTVSLRAEQHPDAIHRRIFFESVAEAIRDPHQPANVAVAHYVPFGGGADRTFFRIQSQDSADHHRLAADFNAVSPEFFGTLRTSLLGGRNFDVSDSQQAKLVAIVNHTFVKQFLGGRNPIGQSLWLSSLQDRQAEIVGVVEEIRTDGDPHARHSQIYVPFAQDPSPEAYFLLRRENPAGVPADPVSWLPEIRRRVARLDPQQPIFDAKTLDDRLNEAFAPFRIVSAMLVWFGSLAVGLSAVGVYGVVAFSVSQRIREIGIRAALGAGYGKLLRLFLQQGLIILAAGLLPGLVGGFAAGRGLKSLLEGMVSANLAPALLLATAIVGIAVVFATLVPACKAASIDPLEAIHYE